MTNICLIDDDQNILASLSLTLKSEGYNIKTFSDHRIAMAFYIASLIAKRTSKFDDLDCIDISFPDFFDKIMTQMKDVWMNRK